MFTENKISKNFSNSSLSFLLASINRSQRRSLKCLGQKVVHLKKGGSGTLFSIAVEKLPKNSLKQYTKGAEKKKQEKNETTKTLDKWVVLQADFVVQAAEVNHGFISLWGDKKHDDSNWN